MHGDGRGMSVGEAEQEHYFSPTRGNCAAAGSGANGSPASGGTPEPGGAGRGAPARVSAAAKDVVQLMLQHEDLAPAGPDQKSASLPVRSLPGAPGVMKAGLAVPAPQ